MQSGSTRLSVCANVYVSPARLGLLCVRCCRLKLELFYLLFCCRQAPVVKRIPPKNYAENYVYRPNTLRIMRTK